MQDVCEEDECFHFAAGSGFPTVNEFRGYPIAFEVHGQKLVNKFMKCLENKDILGAFKQKFGVGSV